MTEEGTAKDVRPQRRVTIQQVAVDAGVSVSAVSKVLRDAYGVSPQMRDRVERAVASLGYRPNAGARGMRGRTYTVGIVVSDLSSPFQPEVIGGIRSELIPTALQEVVIVGGSTHAGYRRAVEALVDRQVDGLILVAPFLESTWLEDLADRVPIVAVALHGNPEGFDTVTDDDELGAALMVEHLVALGHERIAHTGMPTEQLRPPFALSHTVREQGYVRAMHQHGLVPIIATTAYTEAGGHDAAVQLLALDDAPTAVFAGADIAALGVLRAAAALGRAVPDDLSVGGYDNTYMSTIPRVALTTIDQSAAETGALSARLLVERIHGRSKSVHHQLRPTLVRRGTTAAPGSST